jgi:hypothetical protein
MAKEKQDTSKVAKGILGIIIIVIVLIVMFAPSSVNDKKIYKKDYGDKWAFTSDEAVLVCHNDNDIKSPVVVINSKPYGLTGFADGQYGQSDINAINAVWLKDKTTGLNVDLGTFTKEALKLCE